MSQNCIINLLEGPTKDKGTLYVNETSSYSLECMIDAILRCDLVTYVYISQSRQPLFLCKKNFLG